MVVRNTMELVPLPRCGDLFLIKGVASPSIHDEFSLPLVPPGKPITHSCRIVCTLRAEKGCTGRLSCDIQPGRATHELDSEAYGTETINRIILR